MTTSVLHLADFIVLALYFLGIIVMGLWMARRINNFSEFVMPRRFGKVMMMMHTFGTGTHSDQAVAVAAKTYSNGLSGIWYQWLWLFATPLFEGSHKMECGIQYEVEARFWYYWHQHLRQCQASSENPNTL